MASHNYLGCVLGKNTLKYLNFCNPRENEGITAV